MNNQLIINSPDYKKIIERLREENEKAEKALTEEGFIVDYKAWDTLFDDLIDFSKNYCDIKFNYKLNNEAGRVDITFKNGDLVDNAIVINRKKGGLNHVI